MDKSKNDKVYNRDIGIQRLATLVQRLRDPESGCPGLHQHLRAERLAVGLRAQAPALARRAQLSRHVPTERGPLWV